MRFSLVDRILELQPGVKATAIKTLSLAEEYLGDHFPLFPVMPGVLMLEALTQAGAWLVRVSDDFKHSMVVLREARNVKFAGFVAPGQTLTMQVEITGQSENEVKLKAQGTVNGAVNLSARLTLLRYNLADERPDQQDADLRLINRLRNDLGTIWSGQPTQAAGQT